MNRKLALYRHEMRTMIWFFLGGFVAALFFCYILNEALSLRYLPYFGETNQGIMVDASPVSFTSILSDCIEAASIAGILGLIIMSVIQFKDMHKRKSQEYLHSLPFTKRERFAAKMVIGYAALTFTVLVAFVGTLIIRGRFIGIIQKNALLSPYYKVFLGNDTLWHAVSMLLVMWLSLCAVYAIIVFVHAVVNRSILAGVIAFGITMAPLWFFAVVEMLLGEFHTAFELTWRKAFRYFGVLAGQANTKTDYLGDIGAVLYHENFWVLTAICAVIIMLCISFAVITVRRSDLSRGGMLVEKRPARIFLSAGIGICFGAGAGVLLNFWFFNEIKLIPYFVITGIVAVLLFVLCAKVFRKMFG